MSRGSSIVGAFDFSRGGDGQRIGDLPSGLPLAIGWQEAAHACQGSDAPASRRGRGSDGSTRELTGCRKFGWKGQIRQSQHHSHGQKTGAGTAILDVGAGTELPNCFEMAAASWSWSARPRARTFRSAAAWLNVPEAQTERRTPTRYEESAIVSLVDVHVEYPATRVSR